MAANEPAAATAAAPSTAEDDGALRELRLEVRKKFEELSTRMEEIEQRVNEVTQIRASLSKRSFPLSASSFYLKELDKDKYGFNIKKQQQAEAAKREAACSKRMAELMRQFGTILRQITSHKWAWPFMKPVDVEGLQLHDYYDVIKTPMDLGTIRNRMDSKDGSGYKHVQEICDDVRLVFANAMTYNREGTDVHLMAKTLSEKFEDKWKSVLEPKVQEEDSKRHQEELEAQKREMEAIHLAEEAATERLAIDLNHQLDEINIQLEVLRQQVAPQCRLMSTEEKRQLGQSLSQLAPEDLTKAIQIIVQKNPDFKATDDEVEVDIDAQDVSTLWRLQHFVKAVMISQNRGFIYGNPSGAKVKRDVTDMVGRGRKRHRKLSP